MNHMPDKCLNPYVISPIPGILLLILLSCLGWTKYLAKRKEQIEAFLLSKPVTHPRRMVSRAPLKTFRDLKGRQPLVNNLPEILDETKQEQRAELFTNKLGIQVIIAFLPHVLMKTYSKVKGL